jgi:hypothetical protein
MVKLQVNGQTQSFDGDPSMPLLWYLRDERSKRPEAALRQGMKALDSRSGKSHNEN